MTAAPRPFLQLPYSALPELPIRPHAFFATEPVELQLDSKVLGPMKVHLRRHGRGPPLFLVHGLMTSSYSWRYVYEPLGRHYTCWAPDLPGGGRSDKPLGPEWTPANLGTWLGEVMSAIDIRGAKVIANSMGGYLAMHLALSDPGAMSRLVNVHSPGNADLRMHALRGAMAVPGLKAFTRWLIRRDPQRFAFKNVHYFDESLKSREEAKEYGGPISSAEGATALVKYLSETMSTRHMADFARACTALGQNGKTFPVPLLLLYAEKDPMVPPRNGRLFGERIPGAELRWLKDASHFAHVDAVERFLPPVLEFLAAP